MINKVGEARWGLVTRNYPTWEELKQDGFTLVPTEALEDVLEYLKDRFDVDDGEHGQPVPNEEMALHIAITNGE